MKRIYIAFIIACIPFFIFAQQKPQGDYYIRIDDQLFKVTNPTTPPSSVNLINTNETKNGLPIYEYIPQPPQATRPPIAIPPPTNTTPPSSPTKPTTIPQQPHIKLITTQEELDRVNALMDMIRARKAGGSVIQAIPGSQSSVVSLFGLPKTNGRVIIPFHERNLDVPQTRPTVDGSYFNLFSIQGNISVPTPPADSGGFGTRPNPQPPDVVSFGIPPVPVYYWGLQTPITLFPRVTPTGVVFIINLNPYEITGQGMGGIYPIHYEIGQKGSEMVVEYIGPDKNGNYTRRYYTLDPSQPNGIGIVFNNEADFIAYGQRQGYWQPSKTLLGTPIMVANTNGSWRGGQHYATVATAEPVLDKNRNILYYNLKDFLGHMIMPTNMIGTATIMKNPDKKFQVYYNPKTGRYELKVIDVIVPKK